VSGRAWLAWLAVLACVALIWTFSGEQFSGGATSRFLVPFLRWLHPEIDADGLYRANLLLRKSAHFGEYALLGLLSFRALRLTLALPLLHHVGLALLLVLAVAGIDETRQAFLPTRTGSIRDVALDFTGGLFGTALIVALHRRLGVGPPAPRERG
jgi:VanZ family protein